MSEHKISSKVEDVISDIFDGDLKENALEFAMYIRENKMPFKMHSTNRSSQSAKYKNKIICGLMIFSESDKNFVYSKFTGSQACLVMPSFDYINNSIPADYYENATLYSGMNHRIRIPIVHKKMQNLLLQIQG